MLSNRQILSLSIMQMISGSISFIASFTIVVMILRSAAKLNTPFRRLIFGLSVSDAIASISSVFQPLMIPIGVLARGNQGTCKTIAFPYHFGYAASPLYTLGLCTYYLQVIRYDASDHDFAKRIEPWLHCISIAFPLVGAIVNLAVGNFNSSGLACWIYPQNYCEDDPLVECVLRGANAGIYRIIWSTIPSFVSLTGIVYIMVVISLTVIKQERRNARFQFQFQQTRDGNQNTSRGSFRHLRSGIENLFSRGTSDVIPAYIPRSLRASQTRVRGTITQSLLYIGTFLLTYLAALIVIILNATNAPLPFSLLAFYKILTPLGGFFNILVYTRPKVATIRRRRPKKYWWFEAFWMVVKAGGDIPELPRRHQTDNIVPGDHVDINALRRSLASLAQPARDETTNESSEPLNSTNQSDKGVSLQQEPTNETT